MYIDKNIKLDIESEIKLIEQKTECEIVPMIVFSSHHYHWVSYLLGTILAISSSLIIYLSPFNFLNPSYYLIIQLLSFAVGFILARIPKIKRIFISRNEINHEVSLRANTAFLENNLHLTENHNGVLIFISLFEGKIKIICDKNVKDKIDNKIWNEIIDDFINSCKKSDVISALSETIKRTGTVLENHFPRTSQKTINELGDKLIITK